MPPKPSTPAPEEHTGPAGAAAEKARRKVIGDDDAGRAPSRLGAGAAQALAGLGATEPKKSMWKAGVAAALAGFILSGCSVNLPKPVDMAPVQIHGITQVQTPWQTGPPGAGLSGASSPLGVQIEAMKNHDVGSRAATSVAKAFDTMAASGGGPVEARLLSTNLDAWNARWEHLETAQTSIDASYFIFEKDPFGYAYLGFLMKKQLDGVQTRVMLDAMADTFGKNGFKMAGRGKDYLQELANHGGQAFVYHPIWQRPIDALKGNYAVLASNHDKIQVVDGNLSVTGGRNIADDYFAHPTDMGDAWRDIDVAMEGRGAAQALTRAFDAEIGNDFARPVSPDRLGNWNKRDLELVGAWAMMDLWLKDAPMSDADKAAARADPGKTRALADDLVARTLARLPGDVPAHLRRAPSKDDVEFLKENATRLVQHLEARGSRHTYETTRSAARTGEAKILDQTSAAGDRVNQFASGLTHLIDAAKHHVVIENPYVVLTEDMIKAMEAASRRGVRIDIVTNSPLSTDSDVTQAFFLEDWAYVLARVPTAHVHVITGSQKFHGKSAVMDGEVSLVTTYNLDLLSGYVNSEVGAAIKSKELASDLLSAFHADQANPKNGVLEYLIQKDETGKAVLKDGKPIPVFGPEHHLPQNILEEYAKKRELWGHTLRDNIPHLAPLRHPPLVDKPVDNGGG